MGDNFLFLHKEWGPWTHLRVIITNAEIVDSLEPCEEVCIHCGACRKACPSNAIQRGELLGRACSAYQLEISETINNHDYKCEVCLRACPIGVTPNPVEIQ